MEHRDTDSGHNRHEVCVQLLYIVRWHAER
jgi:hypothetical protein